MKDLIKIWLPIIALIFISFYMTYKFTAKRPTTTLSIATGRKSGAYYHYAQMYKELLKKDKITLNIITTAGSKEALALLNADKVDIAFVQGGTVDELSKKNLESLASIYYEPIWIFYKGDDLRYLNEIKSKRISVGETGSGTKPVALELLTINGINSDNTSLKYYSLTKSIEALKNDEIDLFFTVGSPNSLVIDTIIHDKEIKIMDLRRAKAYRQAYLYYTALTLGEGMLSLKENIPPKDIRLLSKTAFLAVNKSLDGELKRLILSKAKEVHSKKGIFEETNEFPNQLNLEIPIGEDAKHYLEQGETFLERVFPYDIAQKIDRFKLLLIPILTLLLPFIKGALPLFRWTMRRKIYKWYKKVKTLDASIESLDDSELASNIEQLEELLKQVKEETSVPLSYMGEYYDLRRHIEMVISRFTQHLKLRQ